MQRANAEGLRFLIQALAKSLLMFIFKGSTWKLKSAEIPKLFLKIIFFFFFLGGGYDWGEEKPHLDRHYCCGMCTMI